MQILEVVIGLVFVFLLYSLLATTIMELLSGTLSLRGKHLERVLRNLLSTPGDQIYNSFKKNALYQQLSGRNLGKKTPPSYLSTEKFRSILLYIIKKREQGDSLASQIQELPDGSLKDVLVQLVEDANDDLETFNQKVDKWYDDVMDRASGWYKRNIQTTLVLLGLGIAVFFNVDTIRIYQNLSENPEARLEVVALAEKFIDKADSSAYIQRYVAPVETGDSLAPPPAPVQQPTFVMDSSSRALRMKVDTLLHQNIDALNSPLGIGWDAVEKDELDTWGWIYMILGWIVTALAISLGAPFWFDLLKKLVNIRSSGSIPPPSEQKVVIRTDGNERTKISSKPVG
jgi:hypothetical protein